jgi:hypothetical protein
MKQFQPDLKQRQWKESARIASSECGHIDTRREALKLIRMRSLLFLIFFTASASSQEPLQQQIRSIALEAHGNVSVACSLPRTFLNSVLSVQRASSGSMPSGAPLIMRIRRDRTSAIIDRRRRSKSNALMTLLSTVHVVQAVSPMTAGAPPCCRGLDRIAR